MGAERAGRRCAQAVALVEKGMSFRAQLARFTPLRVARELWRALAEQFGFGFRSIDGVARLARFVGEYRDYKELNRSSPFMLRAENMRPYLTDRTTVTPVEPTYFLQDTWCARKIAERRPANHVDVGSSAKSMGILAQFVPITFVDIRPVEIDLPGFSFVHGSVLDLPFGDGSIASLSSLCVIEHIGLGRY